MEVRMQSNSKVNGVLEKRVQHSRIIHRLQRLNPDTNEGRNVSNGLLHKNLSLSAYLCHLWGIRNGLCAILLHFRGAQ